MNLRNKVIRGPDGQNVYFLSGKVIDDGRKGIWLLNTASGLNPNYSLWNVKFLDEENIRISHYKGEDSKTLLKELLEDYIEHAFDTQEEAV